jgi:hypothetical protein
MMSACTSCGHDRCSYCNTEDHDYPAYSRANTCKFTSASATNPLATILPFSSHGFSHCKPSHNTSIVHQHGHSQRSPTDGGKDLYWTCCNCGDYNSYTLNAGCINCGHWLEKCPYCVVEEHGTKNRADGFAL